MAQPLRGAACRGAQHASNRLAPLQLPDRQHAGAAAAASLGPYLPGAAAPASQRGSMRAQSGALDTVQPLASRPAPAGVEDAIQGRFMLPAAEVKARLQASGLSLEEFLQSLITPAAQLARPPISNFKVGAVALAGSGNVYVGVNVEFRRGPLNNSIHAEQVSPRGPPRPARVQQPPPASVSCVATPLPCAAQQPAAANAAAAPAAANAAALRPLVNAVPPG